MPALRCMRGGTLCFGILALNTVPCAASRAAAFAFLPGRALLSPFLGRGVQATTQRAGALPTAGLPLGNQACRGGGPAGAAGVRMSSISVAGAPEELRDSVLRFWFGDDFWKAGFGAMEEAEYFQKSPYAKKWYSGGADLDKEISEKFTDLIRAAGKGELEGGVWDEPTGMLAKIILCDQLSRNAFRGTKEAFAYDTKAVELARKAAAMEDMGKGLPSAAIQFFVMPLMHSESLEDHSLIEKKLTEAVDKLPKGHALNGTLQFELQHKEVIDKFGRYPHRNKQYGRETTPEEAEWLAKPDCPGWAKSQ
eukprot:CAMPEP_0206218580 /NCGR_PEP_ID=MMETSP0047_2-20121206/3874_1 /ASSEMBLY_ACC=CAM_ASM_000192 /TAXON_ID=195065 /ORGANISM="Chroomonas mesostigmatica_cf, Strain CCMP1168" /LENGTH=307 /DNA_ID=CAMNT_0053641091 /DNA_START=13 /DNA_END=936 /DNA_ORIENTATION=+